MKPKPIMFHVRSAFAFRLAFSCAINLGMMFQYNFGPTTFASARAFEELRNARVPIRSL